MLTAVVTRLGGETHVKVISAVPTAGEASETVGTEPNPIAIEPNEVAWAAGSFFVLLVIMRYILFPKLKKGMDERYASIRSNIEGADQVKSNARADVANYDAAVAAVRVEAAARVDAARQTLDRERTARLAEVNARVAAARAEADAANNAARAAGQAQVATAVASVVSRAVELATGSAPSQTTVDQTVQSVMQGGGTR